MSELRSYLALGDSFTEGMHDELGSDGRHRGWADRLAEALAQRSGGLRYANLAVRGRLLGQVVEEQLPVALSSRPDLVSFHAGPNDVLRPRVKLASVLHRYEHAVRALREAGCEVLLFTVLERAGGQGRLADSLARRFATFNAGIRATAQRRGAWLVDIGGEPALHDRRMWNEDRLHLAPHGHARVAAAALETLGVSDPDLLGGAPGWWREPLRPVAPHAASRLADDVRWAGRYLVPWVWRRVRGVSSGDGMVCKRPELAPVRPEGPDAGPGRPPG